MRNVAVYHKRRKNRRARRKERMRARARAYHERSELPVACTCSGAETGAAHAEWCPQATEVPHGA